MDASVASARRPARSLDDLLEQHALNWLRRKRPRHPPLADRVKDRTARVCLSCHSRLPAKISFSSNWQTRFYALSLDEGLIDLVCHGGWQRRHEGAKPGRVPHHPALLLVDLLAQLRKNGLGLRVIFHDISG